MILDTINTCEDIKKLNIEELTILSKEVREEIVETISQNGGHLSSNLGIVEATIALYYVFDFPADKLIFDVGHQCYAHKILSGRRDRFYTIRTDEGLSGFPDIDESEFDTFTCGHAGTSIASGLGLCKARDELNQDYFVINIVGDGSIVNGLNLESITTSTVKPKNYIVILNDNGMSISLNKNGLYTYLSKRTINRGYVKSKNAIKRVFGNSFIRKMLSGIKNWFKNLLNKGISFDYFGFKYVGTIDGNNLKETINILQKVKKVAKEKAVILHLKTTKGKGHADAEEHSDLYHGVGKNLKVSSNGFGEALGNKINSLIDNDKKVVAITAAMKDGTGLSIVQQKHPSNFYDVGIAEEFAVTYASGLAKGGLKPFVAIYSTFMQRAYDQVMHDICLQNLPVIFCIDRAGLVGEDGKTHQGVFDISFLMHMPNLSIFCPNTVEELNDTIDYAIKLNSPVAIRYPKTYSLSDIEFLPLEDGLWNKICDGNKITVIATGPRMLKLALEFKEQYGESVAIISARSIKPLDEKVLSKIENGIVFTLEENAVIGGFGSAISQYFARSEKKVKVINFGVKDQFIKHGQIDTQLKNTGLTAENLIDKAKEIQ